MASKRSKLTRRQLLAAAALPGLFRMTEGVTSAQALNKNSAPSQLKITDMRFVLVASNYDYPIIRIDTNQGVYGLGEVRDAGREGTALVLKPHLKGRNPLQIEPILDSIRNFASQQRMGGGYSAVDMALHDIAGKVYNVPAWRLSRTGPSMGRLGSRIPLVYWSTKTVSWPPAPAAARPLAAELVWTLATMLILL